MKKLTIPHSEAIGTAKLALTRLLDRNTAPQFKAVIEKQISLLSEVNWFVLHTIYNPSLPYPDVDDKQPPEDNP